MDAVEPGPASRQRADPYEMRTLAVLQTLRIPGYSAPKPANKAVAANSKVSPT